MFGAMGQGMQWARAAIAAIALLIYALSPVVHGLVHPDHEIEAVLKSAAADPSSDQSPAAPFHGKDCDLFKLYAGHGADTVGAPDALVLPAPLPVTHVALGKISPLPAGAPRGFALGRGPPHTA